jgi:DNA-binding HxlR family transcriptional regulator
MVARSGALPERNNPAETKPATRAQRLRQVQGAQALQLDPLIHERTRLAIVSALAASGDLTFSELKHLLDLTDGNLSVHCRKLETADYIACEKTFEKRVPKTTYRLTDRGRRELMHYLEHMEAVIEAARER